MYTWGMGTNYKELVDKASKWQSKPLLNVVMDDS
jgi:hypothetical protein